MSRKSTCTRGFFPKVRPPQASDKSTGEGTSSSSGTDESETRQVEKPKATETQPVSDPTTAPTTTSSSVTTESLPEASSGNEQAHIKALTLKHLF